MKTLIVYFSFTGNNKALADTLGKDLGADVLQITEPKKRGMFKIMLDMLFNRFPRINELSIPWGQYDHILLMAPIWNYLIANPMKTFVRKNKTYLKNYSFITLCSGRETQNEKIAKQLKKLATYEPQAIIEFEILKLPTYEEQKSSIYKVTPDDLKTFKLHETYQKILETYAIKKEILQ
ncbi:flavodoxin family protein [Aquimarina sp. 2304DJ70-9]|uniref:flavodoxin family protein n=1 Tax=Aquimarina penaris TaxID=3231044 RepID=UPI003461C370